MGSLLFDPRIHKYTVNGLKYPSVTEVIQLAGIGTDYSMVPEGILSQKRDLGKFVHEATEYVDMGAEVPYYPGADGYIQAYRKFKNDYNFEPIEAELQIFHKTLRYAGTIDRVGLIRSNLAIIDFKTVATIDLCSVGPQTAAYEEAYKLMTGIKKRLPRYTLQLKPDGTYKFVQCKDKEDFQAFLSALNIYRWREKHGRN